MTTRDKTSSSSKNANREALAGAAVRPPNEICICAAVQFSDGRIVRGHRHDSCFRTAEGWTPKPDGKGHIQGFITSHNRFVGRKEGAEIQRAAGIESAHYHGPVNEELFSEDLYFDSHDHVAWNTPYREPAEAVRPAPQVDRSECAKLVERLWQELEPGKRFALFAQGITIDPILIALRSEALSLAEGRDPQEGRK